MITRKTRLGHDTDLIIFDSLDCSLSLSKKGGVWNMFDGFSYKTGVLEEDGELIGAIPILLGILVPGPLDDYSLMYDMQPSCRDDQGVWFVLRKRVFQ